MMENKRKIHSLLKIISDCDYAIDMANESIAGMSVYRNRRLELRDRTIQSLKLIDDKWEGTLSLMRVLRGVRRK